MKHGPLVTPDRNFNNTLAEISFK